MRCVTAALIAVAVGGFAASASAARPRATCAKPHKMRVGFKQGKVKLLTNYDSEGDSRWYLCNSKTRLPRLWYHAKGYVAETGDEHFRRIGNRIVFSWVVE